MLAIVRCVRSPHRRGSAARLLAMNPRRHNLLVRPPFSHRHVPPGRMRADGLILLQDTVVLLDLLAVLSNCPLLIHLLLVEEAHERND